MTRMLQAAVTSAAAAQTLAYRVLVDMGVTSGTLYACTGNQYVYVNANTYSPVGLLGGIDPIKEESDSFPRTVRLWLSAVGSSNLFEPLRESMFNRPVSVRRCFLDPQTFTPVASAELMWSGRVNKVVVRLGDAERGNYYEVEAETTLRRKAISAYFNLETHMQTYSGDTFFSLVDQVPLFKAMWGQQPTAFTGVAARGGTPAGVPDIPNIDPFAGGYPF